MKHSRPVLKSKPSFDDSFLNDTQVYKKSEHSGDFPELFSLVQDESPDENNCHADFDTQKVSKETKVNEEEEVIPLNNSTCDESWNGDDISIPDSPTRVSRTNTPQLARQGSRDDSCIVKVEKMSLLQQIQKPIHVVKNSFPSFNVFKNNLKKRKKEILHDNLIDSILLYELLDNLSWSFSFLPEKRKELTKALLLDKDGAYDRFVLQKIMQEEYNVSIGEYEAENIVRYVSLYSKYFDRTTPLFINGDEDNIRSGLARHTIEGLPFSLLLPHDKTMEKWCDCVDRLAIRAMNLLTNLEASNMLNITGGTVSALDCDVTQKETTNKYRRITRREIDDFRVTVIKHRPKRKGGATVDISVYKPQSPSKVVPMQNTTIPTTEENSSSIDFSKYVPFGARNNATSEA